VCIEVENTFLHEVLTFQELQA